MADYVNMVLGKAKAAGNTALQIAALDYAQIAAMAGVTPGKKGESPDDFFWEQVRERVAFCLADEALKAAMQDRLNKIVQALASSATTANLAASLRDDGVVEVRETRGVR